MYSKSIWTQNISISRKYFLFNSFYVTFHKQCQRRVRWYERSGCFYKHLINNKVIENVICQALERQIMIWVYIKVSIHTERCALFHFQVAHYNYVYKRGRPCGVLPLTFWSIWISNYSEITAEIERIRPHMPRFNKKILLFDR